VVKEKPPERNFGGTIMRLSTLVCALALVASHAQAAGGHWIGSWAASPAMPMAAPANNPARGTASFNNQTVTQVVRLSAGGSRLRIRLSNEYGSKALQVGAARVALLGADGAVVAGSERAVTFSGATTALIPPGAPMVSDALDLPTRPLARLRVSLFLPADSNGCTCHMTGMDLISIAPGNVTQAPPAPAKGAGDYRAFLTEVDVEAAGPAGPVIATFGDSITDGYHSTDDANHRWPDRLAERLNAAKRPFAVANTAISGNRVLAEALPIFGQSALSRFDRDVLSVPGVTHVTVLEGVNDLGMTKPTPAAAEIIVGYRQLIARAHEHGLKVIGGTLLPYGGAAYFSPAGEAERQKINAWIRTSHAFDGVIDFDAAIRDPAKPERMRAEWQSGDWLHPNDAGYRVMGDAVDLSLFR
jgi:lysophospholipase L1-like esterase